MRKINTRSLRSSGHGISVLRDMNEILVLNIIREHQPISRIAIAEVTGFEPGTISRILQRFQANGLISEAGSGPSTPAGGRRPRYVTLNPAKRCAIGVDIAPRGSSLVLCDFNGQVQDLRRVPNTGAETTLAAVATEIESLMQRLTQYDEFGGIGVGLVGLVDCEEGIIWEGQNLGWPEPIEVGKALRARIPNVPFYFDNAARLAAMGEIWFGHSRLTGVRNLVYVEVCEGVGTGIIIDGALYRGHHNGAGEFGHIPVEPDGPRCSCGSRGCLEVFAADPATIERYRRASGQHLDIEPIVELALAGDAAAEQALLETAHYLGLGIAPIIYALCPEVIILGGPILRAWKLIEPEVWKGVAERISPPYVQHTTLVPSSMRVHSGLMGAVSLVLAKNFAAPDIFSGT
jgi:predicted NBD/HSP70 family sugar kinase